MTRDITVTNALGLNASNAPLLVQKANTYKSSIWIEIKAEGRRVNAKSLLGVISMGIRKGTVVTLIAEGADAENALDGLAEFAAKGFAN